MGSFAGSSIARRYPQAGHVRRRLLRMGRKRAAGTDRDVERVLRERTDVFERERAVLAIDPGPEIARLLARLPHDGWRRTPSRSGEPFPFDAETFDVAIADAAVLERAPGAEQLARMLRPGGSLVLTVSAEATASCTQRLASAGFFVARGAEGHGSNVLVAVRGEFAAYARCERRA